MKVTQFNQPNKLKEGLSRAGVFHGATVRADIPGVELMPGAKGTDRPVEAMFCRIGQVRVTQVIQPSADRSFFGDEPVALEGTSRLKGLNGFVNIRNALVRSNGRLQVRLDKNSRVEPVFATAK